MTARWLACKEEQGGTRRGHAEGARGGLRTHSCDPLNPEADYAGVHFTVIL